MSGIASSAQQARTRIRCASLGQQAAVVGLIVVAQMSQRSWGKQTASEVGGAGGLILRGELPARAGARFVADAIVCGLLY